MAMETADVVLMNDDLRRIPETIRLSRKSHTVLWQNIGLALGIKAAFFALAVAGMATMWMAVVADMGVSLLVVANGLRCCAAGAVEGLGLAGGGPRCRPHANGCRAAPRLCFA
jgi:cation transport ATPase